MRVAPSLIPAPIIDFPLTLTRKVAALFFIKYLFRSIGDSMKSLAGLGNPACTISWKYGSISSDKLSAITVPM